MPSNHLILFIPFSSFLQSFPDSGSFPLSQFFASDGQSTSNATVLTMNIQCRFPSGSTGLISCSPRDSQESLQHHNSKVFSSVQFSSVTQSCPTLRPMDWSTPGLPVHHQQFIQTHVHWVGDAIQQTHPLCPLLLQPSIFPSIRVFSNESVLHIRWPKYWSLSISPSKERYPWT